jgi:hypothetical protein
MPLASTVSLSAVSTNWSQFQAWSARGPYRDACLGKDVGVVDQQHHLDGELVDRLTGSPLMDDAGK